MKMKLSRILTLIVALGLLGSAVETIPSSVQPVKVAAAQKKTAKKKKTKKTTSKSKKKSKKTTKKATSKSKKKSVKKATSKSKKKSVKKTTSKPKKKPANKTTSKSKKTTSKPKKKTLADRYKPSVRNFKKIKVGVRASSDIFIKNKESLPANTTFKFSKEPNFNKAGSYTTTIIARYSDGSKSISKPFVVVVIPKTDADLYEPTVKDGEAFTGVRFESGSLVTNKGELPKDTWFSIKTSGDFFNKVGMYSAQVITHYPDYSKDTSKPVKVRVSEGFSVETSEDQYSPNSRYLMAKVTNKSNKTLNFRESVVGKDSHGNNLDGLAGVERGPVAPNQTVVLWENLYDEKPYYYDHIDYEIHATDTTHESANSNLKVQIVQKEDSGFCIQTTNIGSKKIYYPEVYVFVYKNGKVFCEWERLLAGYDKDGLEPGESHTIGFNVSDYDDIEFSYTSSYDK